MKKLTKEQGQKLLNLKAGPRKDSARRIAKAANVDLGSVNKLLDLATLAAAGLPQHQRMEQPTFLAIMGAMLVRNGESDRPPRPPKPPADREYA